MRSMTKMYIETVAKLCFVGLLRRGQLRGVVVWLSVIVSVSAETSGSLASYATFYKDSKWGAVKTRNSDNFQVSWVHPSDEVLVEGLLSHLERAHRDLAQVFALPTPRKTKVSVELFPDLKSFSTLSGLPLARFRATGTIALTLDQRLMILSPRNLVSGFSWAVTAVHEYIHYMIREISMNHIPIWLHEGVAQYYQDWPQQKTATLRPADWGLFKRYRDSKGLLSLEALKEPFPYKKNPEEAALAYAQSLILVKLLEERCGLVPLIRWAEEKRSIDKAMATCLGTSQLETEFQILMKNVKVPTDRVVEYYARDFSGQDAFQSESQKVDREARDFGQLSYELFKQGRFKPSVVEMEKAFMKIPVPPPSWARQMALGLMKSGEPKRASSVLQKHLENYPEDAAAWFLWARHKLESDQHRPAWEALMRAFFINPYIDDLAPTVDRMRAKNPEFQLRLF